MMKTIHHIDIKTGDTVSFNCPECGSAHMERGEKHLANWICHNGHVFFVMLYQSRAKTLNLAFIPVRDRTEESHG